MLYNQYIKNKQKGLITLRNRSPDVFYKMFQILIFLFAIVIWQIISQYANPLFIPSPNSVFKSFIQALKNGILIKAFSYSFLRITIATLISCIISFPIGISIFNFKFLKVLIYPIIKLIRFIPVTAFYPLLIMWFGIEEKMKIAFLFIATFVYIMPSIVIALDDLDEDLIDTGKTIGMNKIQLIYKIQIPAVLPTILSGMILMYGIGWSYIAVAETINAKYGLGYIIQQSSSRGRTDLVFMAIIVIMILSYLFDSIGNKIIQLLFPWKFNLEASEE